MSEAVQTVDPAELAEDAAVQETTETPEQKIARLEKEAADTRKEAAKYRTTARENAAAKAELEQIRESQKSEAQKIQERAEKAERDAQDARTELLVERIARRHHLDDDDMDLLGTGTEEQLEARAQKIAAKNKAAADREVTVPPSDKPVEQLRPGATPSDVDLRGKDAYPSSWPTARTKRTRKE
jgi:hypothetical protein